MRIKEHGVWGFPLRGGQLFLKAYFGGRQKSRRPVSTLLRIILEGLNLPGIIAFTPAT
jgi:hypothetical protein